MEPKLNLYLKSTYKRPLTLSDYDCENDVTNNWVLLISIELLTSGDVKHERKISCSLLQSLNVIRLLEINLFVLVWGQGELTKYGDGSLSVYCIFSSVYE